MKLLAYRPETARGFSNAPGNLVRISVRPVQDMRHEMVARRDADHTEKDYLFVVADVLRNADRAVSGVTSYTNSIAIQLYEDVQALDTSPVLAGSVDGSDIER